MHTHETVTTAGARSAAAVVPWRLLTLRAAVPFWGQQTSRLLSDYIPKLEGAVPRGLRAVWYRYTSGTRAEIVKIVGFNSPARLGEAECTPSKKSQHAPLGAQSTRHAARLELKRPPY